VFDHDLLKKKHLKHEMIFIYKGKSSMDVTVRGYFLLKTQVLRAGI
jgi:hypothetical protein